MKVEEGRKILLRIYGPRFVEKIDFSSGDDGCWLWTAYCSKPGYGKYNLAVGDNRYAHRMVFEAVAGSFDKSMKVDHAKHCAKRCVQPCHLRLATAAQNTQNRSGATTRSRLGIRGVWRNKGKFQAMVYKNGQHYYGGVYSTAEEAEQVATRMRIELFGSEWAGRSRAEASA